MTIELLGVNGWTLENKTFYEKSLLMRAVPNFHYVGLGKKRAIPRRGGNSLEWRKLERPTAATTALVEGTPPSETQTTWVNVVATVSQYGAYVKVSDVAMQQSIDDVMAEHSDMFGEHMADSLDRIARAVLVGGTSVQYADAATSRGALTTGNRLDEAEIRTALRNLKRRDAKPLRSEGSKFVMITHPDALYDVMSDTTIQNVLQNAGVRGDSNPYFSGQQFDYLGVRIKETTNVPVVSGGGLSLAAAVHIFQTMVIGEEFYGESVFGFDTMEIVVKPVGSGGTSDPLNQFGTIGWKAAYVARILNQNFGQRIEHGTSANALPA
jgi:N4-gp56 family major capsid protein